EPQVGDDLRRVDRAAEHAEFDGVLSTGAEIGQIEDAIAIADHPAAVDESGIAGVECDRPAVGTGLAGPRAGHCIEAFFVAGAQLDEANQGAEGSRPADVPMETVALVHASAVSGQPLADLHDLADAVGPAEDRAHDLGAAIAFAGADGAVSLGHPSFGKAGD